MTSSYKNSVLIIFLCLSCFLSFYAIPFCIYGQDGYSLWFPIVSEYLKGDHVYQNSPVIFNGQNLASIYGYLPFWKLMRYLNFEVHKFLNITHAVFIVLFFCSLVEIHKGIRKQITTNEIIILFIYSLLSPIITNRVMAGHLNLLFGILPFFSLISIIYSRSLINLSISLLTFWFALSTQAYQILTYYVFYFPLLAYVLISEDKFKKSYFITTLSIFILAFFLNFDNFLGMYEHATGRDNPRNVHSSVVYSYITSHFIDLFQVIISGFYSNLQRLPQGFFHEINYPIGGFLLLFISLKDKFFKIIYICTFILLFTFCLDYFPVNMISELPLIKSFRVPQRSLMILLLFLPIWIFAKTELEIKTKQILIFFCLTLVSTFLDYFDLVVLFFLIFSSLKVIQISNSTMVLISFTGLFCGTFNKIHPSYVEDQRFKEVSKYLDQIYLKYSTEQLKNHIFHFETINPHIVNYVAQTKGIRTIEGYGHPPTRVTKIYESMTGAKLSSTTNVFYLVGEIPNKKNILKNLGVSKTIHFGRMNEIYEEDLK